MEKNCSIRPPLKQKRRRIGLPSPPKGLMKKNWFARPPPVEEESLYQASSKSRMKKNYSTKPGGVLMDQIEEELIY